MRTRKTSKGLTVNAIAGTHVVVLGLNLSDEKRKKCLGFAIQREDLTEGEKYWMSGMKTFEATDPLLGPGGQVSSHDHPFQSFQSADYTAKPEHGNTYTYTYTYTIIPPRRHPSRAQRRRRRLRECHHLAPPEIEGNGSGLAPCKQYAFRVQAIGPIGPGPGPCPVNKRVP